MIFKCRICDDINKQEVPEFLYNDVMHYKDLGDERDIQALTGLRFTSCISERDYNIRDVLSFISKEKII